MPRITNEALADMIGAVDDKVVIVDKRVVVIETKVDDLQELVEKANGRQRADHDRIAKVESIQELCPGRTTKPNPGNQRKSADVLKENWPILTAIAGIATVLGACLKQALEIISSLT